MKLTPSNDLKIIKSVARALLYRRLDKKSLAQFLRTSYKISDIKRCFDLAEDLMLVDLKGRRVKAFGKALLDSSYRAELTKHDVRFFYNLLMFLRHPKRDEMLTVEEDKSFLEDRMKFEKSYYLKNLWSFSPSSFSIIIESKWLNNLKQFEALKCIDPKGTEIGNLAKQKGIDKSKFLRFLMKIKENYPDLIFVDSNNVRLWGIPMLLWEREADELLENIILAKREFSKRPEIVSNVSKQKWKIKQYKWRGKSAVGVWGKKGFVTWHLTWKTYRMEEEVIIFDYRRNPKLLESVLSVGPKSRSIEDISSEVGIQVDELRKFFEMLNENYPESFLIKDKRVSRTADVVAFSSLD